MLATRQTVVRSSVLHRQSAVAAVTSQRALNGSDCSHEELVKNLAEVRRLIPRNSLTLAEKILYSHLENAEESLLQGTSNGKDIRGKANLKLLVDRVAMQDASAQMALLQFMSCGLPSTVVPASIHCDHMIVGERGAEVDLPNGIKGNKEVFDFLESAAKKYGIEFWPPGAGIIHQTVLENYSAPGLMMLGTDSHTPNAGGLGAIAIGVGGADAVDAMVGAAWELRAPKILGVKLTGQLSGWASPKDIILNLAGQLTVRGGTGFIVEYFGKGVQTLSCTGMATVCNMGAEIGATTSIFPYTPASHNPYLESTHRAEIPPQAQLSGHHQKHKIFYDLTLELNTTKSSKSICQLSNHISTVHSHQIYRTPLSLFKDAVKANSWPETFGAGLIGSCTNSSYQDMTRAESLIKQAKAAGLKPKADFIVTPGSEQIRATIERDGLVETFTEAGSTVLANACGPCIGMWSRTDDVVKGEPNAILTSYNRNFPGRNDGNRKTMNFLASPEIVTAMAYSGNTLFNPMTDSITTPTGEEFRFQPPHGQDLPSAGFAAGDARFYPSPAQPDASAPVVISPTSERLAVLEPFSAWPTTDSKPDELTSLKVLVKVKGQCTTDTISAAGPWLKYKEFTIPELAKKWKAANQDWIVVAEHNYGEGSAREHAALQPRYLGGRIIVTKSFARIHETNLKKQGVVPLTFINEADYDKIDGCDQVATEGLAEALLAGANGADISGSAINLLVTKHKNGEKVTVPVKHTLSKDQCSFILAGSALNLLAKKAGKNLAYFRHSAFSMRTIVTHVIVSVALVESFRPFVNFTSANMTLLFDLIL
ncbi:hypothetical protein MRB53_039753 [Persea americana]|nr:hypothetical protein MRB53_039753 [Persea americana]